MELLCSLMSFLGQVNGKFLGEVFKFQFQFIMQKEFPKSMLWCASGYLNWRRKIDVNLRNIYIIFKNIFTYRPMADYGLCPNHHHWTPHPPKKVGKNPKTMFFGTTFHDQTRMQKKYKLFPPYVPFPSPA